MEGTGVTITGVGTPADPWVITTTAAAGLTVEDLDDESVAGVTTLEVNGANNGFRTNQISVLDEGDGTALLTVAATGSLPLLVDALTSLVLDPASFGWAVGFGAIAGPAHLADPFGATINAGWDDGVQFHFIRNTSGIYTISPGAGVTFESTTGAGARTITSRWGRARAVHIGSDLWVLDGNLS